MWCYKSKGHNSIYNACVIFNATNKFTNEFVTVSFNAVYNFPS